MDITEEEVTFAGSDGFELSGFTAHPQDEGQYPSIMLIHEIWGLNDQIRGVARRYAAEGFGVLAPHFFSRYEVCTDANIRAAMGPVFSLPPEKRGDPNALQDLMDSMDEGPREVIRILYAERESMMVKMADDVKSAHEFLCNSSWVKSDKLGVTGFCMGGGLAFQIATELPYSAAVIFYGQNPNPVDVVASLSGPVFAIYAGEDARVNAGIPAIIQAMIENKKTFGMKVYAGMMHGFFNEYSSLHDPDAAADAWQLAVAHFNKYLKE
ncbi:MAG TPA: dienelactone hydrolase family protein [Candidatus Lokiarchaeia archaeon]|nr:dienelactone hydrolase family protein [Candidatus Lokiarchaeia archaeon]